MPSRSIPLLSPFPCLQRTEQGEYHRPVFRPRGVPRRRGWKKKNKGRRSLEDRKWRRLGWLKGGRKVVAAGRQ